MTSLYREYLCVHCIIYGTRPSASSSLLRTGLSLPASPHCHPLRSAFHCFHRSTPLFSPNGRQTTPHRWGFAIRSSSPCLAALRLSGTPFAALLKIVLPHLQACSRAPASSARLLVPPRPSPTPPTADRICATFRVRPGQ